jgi:hypothetical protein
MRFEEHCRGSEKAVLIALFYLEVEILPPRYGAVTIRLLSATCHIHNVISDVIEQAPNLNVRDLDIFYESGNERRIVSIAIKRCFARFCRIDD